MAEAAASYKGFTVGRTAMSDFDFSGKRVLVTGASRGIGWGIAMGFARAGAELIVLADDEAIHAAAEEYATEAGKPVAAHVCDISNRARVTEVMAEIGALDVLVNNAGFERLTPIDEPGDGVEATFRKIIEINVMGTYFVTREAVKTMARGAKIVITASTFGKTGYAGFTGYCASKHANIGFMRALAQELGPKGINVNAICPNWVRTEAAMRSLRIDAERTGRSEDELMAEVYARQAFPGLMEPEDMIPGYLFLASDGAKDITGQTLHIDRGEIMS
jgi:NAD(P)-dependent dehydrogenase (short-subunit alcohol dehydrogenase family)